MFLNSINHFRAIAIIIIVGGHCFYTADITFDTLLERVIFNFVTGGTALFVFISGFLFHYVFYKRYSFKKFMKGKIRKVLLPYTLLSIAPIFLLVSQQYAQYSFYEPQGSGIVNVYIIPALKYYFTGRFMLAYWYIPFIMMTFLISPLHVAFIKMKTKYQILITFVLFVVSLFLHRPTDEILIAQAVVYFSSVYLLGIICSQKREFIYAKLKNTEIYFLGFAIIAAYVQAVLGSTGGYYKSPLAYGGLDIMLLQKVSLCFFFMVWLHRFEHLNPKYLNAIASTSFAIYFTHGFVMSVINKAREILGISIDSPWLWYPFITVGVILACTLLAIALKRLLPNYSRYIIGY